MAKGRVTHDLGTTLLWRMYLGATLLLASDISIHTAYIYGDLEASILLILTPPLDLLVIYIMYLLPTYWFLYTYVYLVYPSTRFRSACILTLVNGLVSISAS